MQQQSNSDYTAKDIQVLEGLEAVRVRPGMYIGSTDQRGLHHLIYEVLDNAVDEAMAGHCDRVVITLDAEGLITVTDNGRGIPIDIHPATGKTALETVMTTLHAGGKFGGGAYKVTGGLHGVGGSVVNGLSEHLRAEVRRDGWSYSQEYAAGLPLGEVEKGDKTQEHGTTIAFRPDPKIFPEIEYDFETLVSHFKEIAFLNKGLEIQFVSSWHAQQRDGDIERSYFFDGGIANLVRNFNRNRRVMQQLPFYYEKTIDDTMVEVAVQYNDSFTETVFSFANCINTQEGGTHMTGFRSALTRVINDYARRQSFITSSLPTPNLKARPRPSWATPKYAVSWIRWSVKAWDATWKSTCPKAKGSSRNVSRLSGRARPPSGPGNWFNARMPWTVPHFPVNWPTALKETPPNQRYIS